ncbi:MAG: hypothetical protein DRI32_05140 [Chloroflexi bacterium]|nr:MAG: hypothetical protein DRI32_05140 [Chloroflexota bacterium]
MLKRKLAMLLAVTVVMGITIPALAVNLNFPITPSPTYSYVASGTGWLSGSGRSHIFTTTLYGGRRYKITLSGPWSADFDLYLYDSNGNRVASSTGNSTGETVYISPSWTGRFYIKVVSYRGSGSFTIRLYKRS